jgi:mitogen-activated protein kinase kinase kinase
MSLRGASPPLVPPRAPALRDGEAPPRVSLSTDDGRSFDLNEERPLHARDAFSQTMETLTRNEGRSEPPTRPASAMSHASRASRMSYLTELRSRRDVSDTASVLTVDQITAEVENRRASKLLSVQSESSDEWTKVGSDEGSDDASMIVKDDDLGSETDEGVLTEEEEIPERACKRLQ